MNGDSIRTLVENVDPNANFRAWQQVIGLWAKSKGWWRGFLGYGEPALQPVVEPGSRDDQERNHYIASKLCLIHSEVSEALEALREGKIEAYVKDGKPEGLETELADTIIRILDLSNALGLDMSAAVANKMLYNVTREYRHGGKAM